MLTDKMLEGHWATDNASELGVFFYYHQVGKTDSFFCIGLIVCISLCFSCLEYFRILMNLYLTIKYVLFYSLISDVFCVSY